MTRCWMAVWAFAGAMAASGADTRRPDVVVFLHGNENSVLIHGAQCLAGSMFERAGIVGQWRRGAPKYQGTAEVIEAVLRDQTAEDFNPGALAQAVLGQDSGVRIELFYDRIRGNTPESATPVLAHVLVHEITHILQGVNRHSQEGIMKAHWDSQDYRQMVGEKLLFADDDLRLIHNWVEQHRRATAGFSD